MCWCADLLGLNKEVTFATTSSSIDERRLLMKEQILALSMDPEAPWQPALKKRKPSRTEGRQTTGRPKPAQRSTRPKFRREVENKMSTATPEAILVTSSHVHQRSQYFFAAGNAHGHVIATCAIAWRLTMPAELTVSDLDDIMFAGFDVFSKTPNAVEGAFPECVNVSGNEVKLQSSFLGTYDYGAGRTLNLRRLCSAAVEACGENKDLSFILSGKKRAVAFWTTTGADFYLFNPQCVDRNNAPCGNQGAARLFKCFSLKSLCDLLFRSDAGFDFQAYWSLYSLHL